MPISTDREPKIGKPDVVVKDHQSKTCYVIDISTPSERNMALKEAEKLSKDKDLEIEISQSENVEHEDNSHTSSYWKFRNGQKDY